MKLLKWLRGSFFDDPSAAHFEATPSAGNYVVRESEGVKRRIYPELCGQPISASFPEGGFTARSFYEGEGGRGPAED